MCGNFNSEKYEHQFSNVHICDYKDSELNNLLKQIYTIETAGINGDSSTILCNDEQRAIDLLKKYTKQRCDGHYETAMLWRYTNIILPDSYDIAKKILISLEKILKIMLNC